MMKKAKALLLALCLMVTSTVWASATTTADTEMRGVWVSTVYNLDYPATATTSSVTLAREADEILDNCVAYGINTVFLQVRPTADALYPSDYFPWSAWLTGAQGTAPTNGFDPLAYWVDEAHARGLELHVWINPYRITKKGEAEFDALTDDHPAKLHSEWVVQCDDQYYFDPGLPAVRQYVTDAAVEIVENYDVDGVHMDDYFYPSTDFNDAETYARYGGDFDNIADWRRDNVNQLVTMLDEALHAVDPDLQFGISPTGIWANSSTDARGSATGGYEHYTSSYADSLYWIKNGLVDYIIPQIYWEIGHSVADFATLASWWSQQMVGSDVELYIGMAAYRISDTATDVWSTSDPLFASLDYLTDVSNVSGTVYFRYGSLVEVDGLGADLAVWHAEQAQDNSEVVETPDEIDADLAYTYAEILSLFLFNLVR